MSKFYLTFIWLAGAFLNPPGLPAQHCPPIVESYLQSVSIQHTQDGIALDLDYRKTGGQPKASYQAYILAFSHFDTEKLATMTPQDAIESKTASVVHTQRAERQDNGCYRIHCSLKASALVADMLDDSRLDRHKIDDFGGWKSFQGKIRFAVFIPFLDDERYAVLEGLPAEKHECNYRDESALMFEPLSPTISVHFGIVQAVEIPEGEYHLQINGHRPLAKPRNDSK